MNEIMLRPVQDTDMDLIYQWANEPTVRANAFSTKPIPYEDHVKWFRTKQNDSNCFFYIAMNGTQPVGVIRIDRQKDKPEIGVISYSVDGNVRGLGIGTRMLMMVCVLLKDTGLHSLLGQVKPSNPASMRAFQKAGYMETNRTVECVEYQIAL